MNLFLVAFLVNIVLNTYVERTLNMYVNPQKIHKMEDLSRPMEYEVRKLIQRTQAYRKRNFIRIPPSQRPPYIAIKASRVTRLSIPYCYTQAQESQRCK